ncbi:hypothetical protein niasHS_013544 [Heterodera schachtii]|uniref:Nicastrin n=1 Tax=Heterodera schachtii TaxID=97005 RepID=A0ABD2IAM8_HETSC
MLSLKKSQFLILLLFNCFVLRVFAYDGVEDQIFIRLNNTDVQCVRMLNGTHSIGCQSSRNGNVGVLTEIVHAEDVQNAIGLLPLGLSNIIAVIQLTNINDALIGILRSHAQIVGILLIHRGKDKPKEFSEDGSCPNRQFTFYSNERTIESCHGWNQKNAIHSDGLKFIDFNKPLRLVTSNEEIDLIFDKCIEPFNKKLMAEGLRCVGRMTQFMSAAGNTKICLERTADFGESSLCEVLEDMNVFLMLPPLSKQNHSADQFVLAARMDSFSTFRGAKGGDLSVLSSLVSLLLVAHSVGQKMDTFNRLASLSRRQLLFAFLHGESLGYIGSSRWVWDMGRGHFPAVAENISEESKKVRQIGVDELSFFMELQQIGASPELYAHTDAQIYKQNKSLIDTVLHNAKGSGEHFHFVDPSSVPFGAVPPSSYHSIMKASDKVPGLILSSFGSTDYEYPYLNSFFDDQIRTHPKQLDEFLRKIIDASNIALRAALSYVFANNATEMDQFKIDENYAKELGECFFVANWSCPLFRTLTNATNDRQIDAYLNDTANSFSIGDATGRNRRPIIRHLLFFLLTHSTGSKEPAQNVRTQSQCRDRGYQENVYNFVWMNDRNGNGSCYRTSTYQTVARSPAFEIGDYNFTSGQYSTWVASDWPHEAKFELYLKADLRLELYAFVAAFVVLLLCVPLLFVPKEQWFLDNFLPPGSPQPL